MGYIIIDEEKLKDNLKIWNSQSYYHQAMSDVVSARVDYSHMLKALSQAEKSIDEDIKKLEEKKNNIKLLMDYAILKER